MYKDTKTSIKNHTISIDQQLETLKLSIQTKEDNIYKQISEVKKSLSVPKDGTTPHFTDGVNLDKIKEDLTAYIDAIITAKLGDQRVNENEAITPEVDSNTKTALNARIDELQTTINNLQPKPDDVHPLPTSIETDKIREVLEEKERIDKKKCNLIFSNLEESNSIEEDEDRINRIIKDKLKIREDINITLVARLGKKTQNIDRLVKVTFESLNMKKLVLRKATQMRQLDEEDPDHLVYIRPDLTKLQIQASKNLSEELKSVRENTPGRWIIRRGKIINLDAPENPA